MTTTTIDNFNPQTLEQARNLFIEATTNNSSQESLEKIIKKTAQLCQESLFPFIEKFASSKGIEKTFFNLVIEEITQELKTKPLLNRILYAIEDEDTVLGYLIATIHDESESFIAHNQNVNTDPIFHETVRKCRALITELGPLSHGLDKALVDTALKESIPVHALETKDFQSSLTEKIFSSTDENIQGYSEDVKKRVSCLNGRTHLFKLLGFHAYLTGNIPELRLIKNMDTIFEGELEHDRHNKWLHKPITKIKGLRKMLLPQHVGPQKPICIALDAMSLFGNPGIISKLGLNFRRIVD